MFVLFIPRKKKKSKEKRKEKKRKKKATHKKSYRQTQIGENLKICRSSTEEKIKTNKNHVLFHRKNSKKMK